MVTRHVALGKAFGVADRLSFERVDLPAALHVLVAIGFIAEARALQLAVAKDDPLAGRHGAPFGFGE